VNGRRLFWIVLPVLVLVLVLQARHAERRWRASRTVKAVQYLAQQAGQGGPAAASRLRQGLALLRQIAPLDPALVDVPVTRGGLYLLLKRPQAAIRSYREALRLEPRGEVYANLGRAYLMNGDEPKARQAFRTAVRLDRNWVKPFRRYLPELQQGRKPRTGAAQNDKDSPRSGGPNSR